MRFPFGRSALVSAAASLIGIALVANGASLAWGGHVGEALMRAGMGLYCCCWAFVPYEEFLRVARMPMRLGASAERRSYAAMFPVGVLVAMAVSMLLTGGGFIYIVAHAFQ